MSTAVDAVRGRLEAAADPYRHRYTIAITVTLASILELLDTSIVNVAIPHMMGNLGATLDQIAWVSTGYIVANVIVLPITGWLSAFFGRRRYFAGSIALFTVASFMCGNAGSLESLIFWRIIQGLGGGALLTTSRSEEHTSELQSRLHLVCRLLLEKKKKVVFKSTLRMHKRNRQMCFLVPISMNIKEAVMDVVVSGRLSQMDIDSCVNVGVKASGS